MKHVVNRADLRVCLKTRNEKTVNRISQKNRSEVGKL